MSDPEIRYKGTTARARWRALYLKVETTNPGHKAAQRWLASAASELYDVAEVKIKAGGVIAAEAFDPKKTEEAATLDLSRDAVLGIKYAVIAALTGASHPQGRPSTLLERRDLLEAVSGIGPDGKLRRLIEAEAKLPESDNPNDEKLFEESEPKK